MILVTGGAGVVGSRLVKSLMDQGHRVRALTLPNDPYLDRLSTVDCEITSGDISRKESLLGIFKGVKTVYHLAALIIAADPIDYERVNVEGTRNVVEEAAKAGVRHFIYISSAAAIYPGSSEYARSKARAEEIVRNESGFEHTIVRPTLLYDENGGQEFMLFLNYLKKFPIVPFIGRGRARKNPVTLDDVVQGLLAIADNPRAHGRIYNFSGGEELSIWELAELLLAYHGLKRIIVPVPVWLCRLTAWAMEKAMKNPPLTRYAISRIEAQAGLDNSSARRELGYHPLGIREGLKKYFQFPAR